MHRTDFTALPRYWAKAAEVKATCDRLLGNGDFFGREEEEHDANPHLTDFNCPVHPAYMHVDLHALAPLLPEWKWRHLMLGRTSQDQSGQMSYQMSRRDTWGCPLTFDIVGAILFQKDVLPADTAQFRLRDVDWAWLGDEDSNGGADSPDYRDPRVCAHMTDVGWYEAERQERVWSVDAAKLILGQPLDADLTLDTTSLVRAEIDRIAAILVTLSIPFGWQAPGINTLIGRMYTEGIFAGFNV